MMTFNWSIPILVIWIFIHGRLILGLRRDVDNRMKDIASLNKRILKLEGFSEASDLSKLSDEELSKRAEEVIEELKNLNPDQSPPEGVP